MNHSEAFDLLEAYAFGTLGEDETNSVEAHLQTGCAECNARLREVAELAARLAVDVAQAAPSEQVKQKLLKRIGESRFKTASEPYKIRKRFNWFLAMAAVLLIALATSTLGLFLSNRRLSRRLVDAQDVTALLNSPGMQFVDLEGVDPNPQAFGKVVMDPKKGAAVVYMYRLPQTPEGMEYQLWVMREGKPTSAGIFTVSDSGNAVLALDELPDPSGIASFLVTIEPKGGQIAPTGMMYLTGPNKFHSND